MIELISLGLTIPTVVISLIVVWLWGPQTIKIIFHTNKLDATDWFIAGVCIGFFGSILDNVYWGIAWTAVYLDLPSAGWWMSNGALPNIFSRQSAGTIAAYCHVRSYMLSRNASDRQTLNAVVVVSFIGGVLFALGLMVSR